jgi:ACT domain.
MLNREVFLIANGGGARLGEFLVELNFDQPGILATLSNIFAEHDVNIINIAVDGNRQNLHFIVDLTLLSDDQIQDILKQLHMFAFVKKVKHRISTAPIFVPRWITHVINGRPVIAVEKDFTSYLQEPTKLAEEIAKRDAKTVKELATALDVVALEEALYLVQLRGFAIVNNTAVKEGRLVARLCNLVHLLTRRYLDVFFKELGIHAKMIDEGACLQIET